MKQDAERLVALLSGHADVVGTLVDSEWESLIELARENSVAPVLLSLIHI